MKYLLEGEKTERLDFRPVRMDDYDAWLRFFNDPSSSKYLWGLETLDPAARCDIWFSKVFHRYENNLGGMNALIERATGSFVGQCGLLIQEVDGVSELEIGYSLMPEFRRKGFATEAARKCRDFAFANNFADSLISLIHPDNIPSQRVALNNGMKLDKKVVFQGYPVLVFRIRKPE